MLKEFVKKNKTLASDVGWGFLLLVGSLIVLFLLFAFFPNVKADLKSYLEGHGLFGYFSVMTFGSLPVPFPIDAVFITAFSFYSQKWSLIGLSILASTIGSVASFWIAWSLKEKVQKFTGHRFFVTIKRYFEDYGDYAVLLIGIIPFAAVFDVVCFFAGLFDMDSWRFLVGVIVGRTLHFLLIAFILSVI
ncbi:SNARE associated Golgi protein [uncultured archaeon]|nr:SNARE associated Golgi protein [uncultured archaeon]